MPFEQPKLPDEQNKKQPEKQKEEKQTPEKQEPMRDRVKHAILKMEKIWQLNIDDTKTKIEKGEQIGENKAVLDGWRFDLKNFENRLQRLKPDSFQGKLSKAERLHQQMLSYKENIDPQNVFKEYVREMDVTHKAYRASCTKQRPDGDRKLLNQVEYLRGRLGEIEDILDEMK